VGINADDRNTRVDLSIALMRTGKLDEAKRVLEEGVQRDPEGNWNELLAALYVNYHDLLLAEGNHPVNELLLPISRALEHEPNFLPALERLTAHVRTSTDGNREVKSVLARVIAEGREPALAHLALGNVAWLEGDIEGGVFHFERSLAINPRLAVVMNNLAWLVSHDPVHMDLERALGMAEAAIELEPDNGSFLDTRGSIYLLMGRNREALNDFEKALPTVKDKATVHAKLADAYSKLGRHEIAQQHLRLEAELRGTQSEKE